MRLIRGKLLINPRMTLRTGTDNFSFGQTGAWVCHRKYIMVTVAVVTGSDVRGLIRLPQSHGFAVISFAVMLEPILVTFPAALITQLFEMSRGRFFDIMGTMAIRADRAQFITFDEELPMDTRVIGFLDAQMTFTARLRNIRMIGMRILINAAFDIMDAMAIIAGRRHDEPHFNQRATMNTIEVMARGIRFPHAISLGQLGVIMTS